jgi:hypothetical protein
MAEGAGTSEPVSDIVSLLNRENTGNFTDFGSLSPYILLWGEINLNLHRLSVEFPTSDDRECDWGKQGMIRAEQEILVSAQGMHTYREPVGSDLFSSAFSDVRRSRWLTMLHPGRYTARRSGARTTKRGSIVT